MLFRFSSGPYGRNQKHVGVFGAKHQNLYTGTVFRAEQHGKSHLAKKWHGHLKKCVFLKKIQEKVRCRHTDQANAITF